MKTKTNPQPVTYPNPSYPNDTMAEGVNMMRDWDKLKLEWLTGTWDSLAHFKREKGIPLSETRYVKGWLDAKKAYNKKTTEKLAKKMADSEIDSIVETRIRQRNLARYMQVKGAVALKEVKVANAEEARKLIQTGMVEERKIIGIEGGGDKANININIGMKTNYDKLLLDSDYEEIVGFVAELKRIKRERNRLIDQPDAASSTGEIEDGETV